MAVATISIPLVMDAIRRVESGGNTYAIRDNTADRSYSRSTTADAVAKAKELLALGHNLDLGAYQINSIHQMRPGVSVENIFESDVQSRLAGEIFDDFYAKSKVVNGDTDTALCRAVGAYNMGTAGLYRDNEPYTARVVAAAGAKPLPQLGGVIPSDGGSSTRSLDWRYVGQGFQTPDECRIGDPIAPSESGGLPGSADDEDREAEEALADAVVLLGGAAVVFVLVKAGLLAFGLRLMAKCTSTAVVRQVFRRRHSATP